MKCSRCGHDSKYRERPGRICPQCKKAFAFEPRESDPVTDMLFKNAIAAVAAQGQVRFGVEHLYYEVCRRKRRKVLPWGWGFDIFLIACSLFFLLIWFGDTKKLWAFFVVLITGVAGVVGLGARSGAQYAALSPERFRGLYDRWSHIHGLPEGVIQRREQPAPPVQTEPDLGDYSFDRVVVCDRARTVDLLLANNFHFENNCAILSIDGYPPGPFATVRTMLQRNPNLHVFVLHDATPEGCRLARRLVRDRDWFPAGIRVIDVGLRPGQARQFIGRWQRADGRAVETGDSITAQEAKWLSRSRLELAAVRPAQVIKRLFRAMNRQPLHQIDGSGGDSSDVFIFVDQDNRSFATDADALDASADSFG